MQVNNNSNFITYELSELDVANGSQLNYLQAAIIQNQRVNIMQDLVNLKPDDMSSNGKETYWQREAYLRGQLDILTHLIDTSKAIQIAVDPNSETNQGN